MKDDSFYLPDFISIEITNHCNIKCIICPHGHDLIKDKGYMSFNTFKKIIDEAYMSKLKLRKIGLQGIGESLLHPDFVEMAKYGKSKKFYQQLTTNALFLTPSKADEIVESNCLDRVEISFDNNSENYKKFKGGKVFEIIMENIKYFLSVNKSIDVYIKFIQYHLNDDSFQVSDEIIEIFKNFNVKFVQYNISTWRGTLKMNFLPKKVQKSLYKPLKKEPDKEKCNNGSKMAMFGWNGNLRSCYLDYNGELCFGNINDSHLMDLLLCEERKKFIDNIATGNHKKNFICKDCLSPYNRNAQKIKVTDQSHKTTELHGSQNDLYDNYLK